MLDQLTRPRLSPSRRIQLGLIAKNAQPEEGNGVDRQFAILSDKGDPHRDGESDEDWH